MGRNNIFQTRVTRRNIVVTFNVMLPKGVTRVSRNAIGYCQYHFAPVGA